MPKSATTTSIQDKLSELVGLLIANIPAHHTEEQLDRFIVAIENYLLNGKVLTTIAHPDANLHAVKKIIARAKAEFEKDTGLKINLIDILTELFELCLGDSERECILNFSIGLGERIKSALMNKYSVLEEMRKSYKGKTHSEWPGLDIKASESDFNVRINTKNSAWQVPGGVRAYLQAGWSPPQAFVDDIMSANFIFTEMTIYMGSGGFEAHRISNESLNVIKGNGEIGAFPSKSIGYHFLLTADNGEKIIADSHGGEAAIPYGSLTVTKLGPIQYEGKDVTAEFNKKIEFLFDKMLKNASTSKSMLINMETGKFRLDTMGYNLLPMIDMSACSASLFDPFNRKKRIFLEKNEALLKSLFTRALISPMDNYEQQNDVIYFSVEQDRVMQILGRINAYLLDYRLGSKVIPPTEVKKGPRTNEYIIAIDIERMRFLSKKKPGMTISDLEDIMGEEARLAHLSHKNSSFLCTFFDTKSMWLAIHDLIESEVLNPYQIYLSDDNESAFYILGPINEAGFPLAHHLAEARMAAPSAKMMLEDNIQLGLVAEAKATIVIDDPSLGINIIRQTLEAAIVPLQWHEAIKIEFNAATQDYVIKLDPRTCVGITRDLINKALNNLSIMTHSELINEDKESVITLKNPQQFVDDIKKKPAIARRLKECINAIIKQSAGLSLDLVVHKELAANSELVHLGEGKSFQLATIDPGTHFLKTEMNTLILNAYEAKDIIRITELLQYGDNTKVLLVAIIKKNDANFLMELLKRHLINPNTIILENDGQHYSCLAYALSECTHPSPVEPTLIPPASAGGNLSFKFFERSKSYEKMVGTLLNAGASPLPITDGSIISVSPLSQLNIMSSQEIHDVALQIIYALEAQKDKGHDIIPILNESINNCFVKPYLCGCLDMRAIRKMVALGATVTPSLIFSIVEYSYNNPGEPEQEAIYAFARELQGHCAECTQASLVKNATRYLRSLLDAQLKALDKYCAMKNDLGSSFLSRINMNWDIKDGTVRIINHLYHCFPDFRESLAKEIEDELAEFKSKIIVLRKEIPEAFIKADKYIGAIEEMFLDRDFPEQRFNAMF